MIESLYALKNLPIVNSFSEGDRRTALISLVVFGVLTYLIKRYLDLKNIRDSFTKSPETLNVWELYWLAKKIEFLQSQEVPADQRYKVAISLGWGKKKFVVGQKADRSLRVQYVAARLGRGAFGKVVKLIDLHDGVETALKVAKCSKRFKTAPDELKKIQTDKAQEDIKKEHENLMLVHAPGKKVIGVQDKPLTPVLTITKLYTAFSQVSLAFEGPIYHGNLGSLKVLRIPIHIRLNMALQVLEGMHTLLKSQLVGHDLKPPNILFRFNKQSPNPFVVHICDFGGVTHEDDLGEELNRGMTHTPEFSDKTSIKYASYSPIHYIRKKFVRDSEKRSLGITIFWILTGKLPGKEGLTIEDAWKNAGFSDPKYQDLLTALKANFGTGFWASLFKIDIVDLKQKVQALCD